MSRELISTKKFKERSTAKKIRIVDLVNGKYFPGDKEQMKASYIITPFGQKVSRVNLIGTVIEKFENDDGSYSSITIDDGTETIGIRTFKEDVSILKNIDSGDLVLAVGKMKEYNGEIYVNGEIVRKVTDANIENMRRLEILNELVEWKKIFNQIKEMVDKSSEDELKEFAKKFDLDEESLQVIRENLNVSKEIDYKPKILEVIKALDDGKGAEISKIIQICQLPENAIEKSINELLASAVIYEPTAGKLRVV